MSRRCRVDDDVVIGGAGGQTFDFHQAEDFVDARQRQIEEALDLAALENGAALEDRRGGGTRGFAGAAFAAEKLILRQGNANVCSPLESCTTMYCLPWCE